MPRPSLKDLIDRALDISLEQDDHLEVEVQDRPTGRVVYVHLNGVTVLRVAVGNGRMVGQISSQFCREGKIEFRPFKPRAELADRESERPGAEFEETQRQFQRERDLGHLD